MLCSACRNIDLEQVLEEDGHQLHDSYNDLIASAAQGCLLCSFFKEKLPLYKRDLTLCKVQRVDIDSGEWLGGAEEVYEPLSNIFPAKKFNKKLSSAPVILRMHQDDIQDSDETGIRQVQIAIPDFHRHDDMRFDLWQEIELYAGEDSPSASVIRGRPIEATCRSDKTFELVASWLKTCLDDHETCGNNSKKRLPTRVLDLKPQDHTSDLSLYETKGKSGNWVALSHCWGAAQMVKTTTKTLKSHIDRINFQGLPANFQDAITITRKLGYRYLWIDSLCIIQDSVDDWSFEAGQMRNVYQNAVLTIMAEASSDGGEGIFYTGDSKRKDHTKAIRVPYIGDDSDQSACFYVRGCLTPGLESLTPLRTRGWVLQEDLLSPRIVKYSAEQLFWTCRSLRCCEADPETDRRLEDIFDQRRPIEEIAYTDLSKYEEAKDYLNWWYSVVVDNFTHRKLTFATDALPATGGIARQVQDSTDFTYLAGLWLEDIQRGLLWISCGQGKRSDKYAAPSWSWASMIWNLGEREWIYDYIHVVPEWEYNLTVVSNDIQEDPNDSFGKPQSGGLRVRGYWKAVDDFADCPSPFFDNPEDRRLLYQRSESLEYRDRSTELLPKQIVCSHDTVAGIEGAGTDIFEKGIIYLMVLKSDFPFQGEEGGEGGEENDDPEEEDGDEDEEEPEEEVEDGSEANSEEEDGESEEHEGTIYALILEPTGSPRTYTRIGVAQIPEDDGMAEGWKSSELKII
ncbi:heterokaryon incompatibility protein-domain-containing protein [Xylogone sp. PMI_703]|nr:heterokaryon incompatibility protein-domain-containing protein [Xylogone sp. PMI_703]